MKKLKVAFITPEAVPFAKTGGLADISGILPRLLTGMGHEVKMFMPMYRQVRENIGNLNSVFGGLAIRVGDVAYSGDVYTFHDDGSSLEINFIANEYFFDRPGLYIDNLTGKDYQDNLSRFVFFVKTTLQTLKRIDWQANIYHANDWQTALVPSYLKTACKNDPFFENAASVFTIHNMAYQGTFPSKEFKNIGLEQSYFAPEGPFEFWGKVNLMKSAISLADIVSTVSPTYAREIQESNEYGMGLEGVLKNRSDRLFGILNGVDYEIWSPEKDELIPYSYSAESLGGKKKNKRELLKKAGLTDTTEKLLIGIISRLDSQKGFDIISEVMDEILNLNLNFILLGTGTKEYHRFFAGMEKKHPDKFRAFLEFDNRLAHLIEAGADIFLMPSRYEPCGLNQMYSLKYGTVPIVRKTGGLADTVIDYDEKSATGTGFVFEKYSSAALLDVIKRALKLYKKKRIWKNIVRQGMNQDFSWKTSARKYSDIYHKALDVV